MVFAHTIGDHLFDLAHHAIIFGIGLVAGLSYVVVRAFSKGK